MHEPLRGSTKRTREECPSLFTLQAKCESKKVLVVTKRLLIISLTILIYILWLSLKNELQKQKEIREEHFGNRKSLPKQENPFR